MHFNTAQVHFDNDETYSGIEELDKIIDSHPKLAEAHFSKGMALLSMGQNDQALTAFEEAIKINPQFSQAFYYKGLTLTDLHRYLDAINSYKRAVHIYPDYAIAFYNLGNLQRDYQNQQEAIQSFKSAYEIWNKRLDSNPYYFLEQPELERSFKKARQYLKEMGIISAPSYYSINTNRL